MCFYAISVEFFFGKLVVKKSNEHVNQMYEIKWILLAYTAIIVKDTFWKK